MSILDGEVAQGSRKGSYCMRDAAYDFWYTFVMPAVTLEDLYAA